MTKVNICTPMFNGQCSGHYTMGLIKVIQGLPTENIEVRYSYLLNESLITRARNTLADEFLKGDGTHLLFIDADIGGFGAEDVKLMLDADKDIICGVYPKKEINWRQVHSAVKHDIEPQELSMYSGQFVTDWGSTVPKSIKEDAPLEIAAGGTGFMLIKREVFEKLEPLVPKYINGNVVNSAEQFASLFFDTSVDEERQILLSEDFHFCYLAKKHGFKVHIAPWVKLTHVGSYYFNGLLPTHK
jgi:hypothetical protein